MENKSAKFRLTVTAVEALKMEVKAELDRIQPANDRDRGDQILQKLDILEDDLTVKGLMTRFIYVMWLLIFYAKVGGASEVKLSQAAELGKGLLKMLGIDQNRSRLSYLYCDLFQALAQIDRAMGQHLRAAWRSQTAEYFGRLAKVPGQESHDFLSSGIRSLRLGQAQYALNEFANVCMEDLSSRQQNLLLLNKIKIHRLRREFSIARNLITGLDSKNCDIRILQEIQWETLLIDIAHGDSYQRMLSSVRLKSEHGDNAAYAIEASLWVKAIQSERFLKKMVKVLSVARRPGTNVKVLGPVYSTAVVLDQCYDAEVSLVVRISDLGDSLRHAGAALGIEEELLIWVAAARWLSRTKNIRMAALALGEYIKISLNLTDGKYSDCLGVASDLLERDWAVHIPPIAI